MGGIFYLSSCLQPLHLFSHLPTVGERLPYIHKSLLIFGNTSPPDPRVQGIVVLHLDFGVSKFGPRTWRKLRAEESTDLH